MDNQTYNAAYPLHDVSMLFTITLTSLLCGWKGGRGGNLIDILKVSSGTYLIFGVCMIINFNIFIYKGPQEGVNTHMFTNQSTHTQ